MEVNMINPTNTRSKCVISNTSNYSFVYIYLIMLVIFIISFSSSAFSIDKKKANFQVFPLIGDHNKHKSIFVFLDGTRNVQESGTNVWQAYNLISKHSNPQTTGFYREGVGSAKNPIISLPGSALGLGMEKRILDGYEFIAKNYNLGDDVYIFGFSRGAHEARSLAGFLAYVGVPILTNENRNNLKALGNKILELTKSKIDDDYLSEWVTWKPGQEPFLAAEIRNKYEQEMQSVEVKFMGVWDTVPGSSFKEYGECKENIGFIKKWFYWLPVISKGDRYKVDSYPAIRTIAHAVSIDEKRSKFRPILLCPVINPTYTEFNEMWFPGAHSDVGGGYEDSIEGDSTKGLSSISLNWMLDILSRSYSFNTVTPTVQGNANGLAHWSYGDSPGNKGSKCEDRQLPEDVSRIHVSYYEREQSSPTPIRVENEVLNLKYPNPVSCSD